MSVRPLAQPQRSSKAAGPSRPGQVPVGEVVASYYVAGAAEGVRPDLAFVQAVHEIGGFTNSDAQLINNFAGVAHYDQLAISGTGWATAEGGVIGHIQLLKRYALGNNAALALPDQSVQAGATATTFGALTGTWATHPGYWPALARLYNAARGTGAAELCTPAIAGPVTASGADDDRPATTSKASPSTPRSKPRSKP